MTTRPTDRDVLQHVANEAPLGHSGPMLLTPELLRQVSGGVLETPSCGPKGTWQEMSGLAGPKGTW